MKIALLNENSQADKNSLIYKALRESAEAHEHEVHNYGMFKQDQEHQLTYVQIGVVASILLNSGAVDFVVTGCGTGQGALMAANAFDGVLCGHIETPLDAYLFGQVNNGNCVSIPYAQNFGWGAELNLKYIFDNLFGVEKLGAGYPKDRVEPQQRNKKILDTVKNVSHASITEVIKNIDQEFLKSAIDYPEFKQLFYANAKDKEIIKLIKDLIGE